MKKLTMGMHKFKHMPCGFCFVEYGSHEDAERAVTFLNRSKLDGRILKVDLDVGVTET